MKKLLFEVINLENRPHWSKQRVTKENWYPKGREVKKIEFSYFDDGAPRDAKIYFYNKPFFDQEAVKKAVIPQWKVYLYRLMFWKYKEIENGVFVKS